MPHKIIRVDLKKRTYHVTIHYGDYPAINTREPNKNFYYLRLPATQAEFEMYRRAKRNDRRGPIRFTYEEIFCPEIASGSKGEYVWMPMACPNRHQRKLHPCWKDWQWLNPHA